MALEQTVEENKQADDQPPAPPTETLLETKERDPDEAVLAEQAIRGFIRDRLEEWSTQIQSALDTFEAWAMAQSADDQPILAERELFDSLGDRYIGELKNLGGGGASPISSAIASETYNTVAMAEHSEHDIGNFINEMRRGVRDACWYTRDACQSILSDQWAALLDGAYGGAVDFVPLLFQFGLPSYAFDPGAFSQKLIGHADAYRMAKASTKEKVAVEEEVDPDGEKDAADQAQQLAAAEEQTKAPMAATL